MTDTPTVLYTELPASFDLSAAQASMQVMFGTRYLDVNTRDSDGDGIDDQVIAYLKSQTDQDVFNSIIAQDFLTPRILRARQSSTDTITDDASGGIEAYFATTYTIPANYFVANRSLLALIGFEIITGASPPTLRIGILLGATQVFLSDNRAPQPNATKGGGLAVLMMGTTAPAASAAIFTSVIGDTRFSAENASVGYFANTLSYSQNLATNGALILSVSALWASNVANTHTIGLRNLLVIGVN